MISLGSGGFAYLSYFSQEQDKFFDEIDSFIPPRVQRIQELYRLYKQGKVTFGKYFFTKKRLLAEIEQFKKKSFI